MHIQPLLTVTGIFCSLVIGLPVQAEHPNALVDLLSKLQRPQIEPQRALPAAPPDYNYEVNARYSGIYRTKNTPGKPLGPPVHHEYFLPHNEEFQGDHRLVDCVMEELDLGFGDESKATIPSSDWNSAITKCDGDEKYKVADLKAKIIFYAYKLRPGDRHPWERTDIPKNNGDGDMKFNESLDKGGPKKNDGDSKPKPMHILADFTNSLAGNLKKAFTGDRARKTVPGAPPGAGMRFFGAPRFAPAPRRR